MRREHGTPKISVSLRKIDGLIREQVALEAEIERVRGHILAASNVPRRRTQTVTGRLSGRVRAAIEALHEAGEPVDRHVVAKHLGVAPTAVGYYLTQAIGLGFVERAGHGLYKCTASASAVLR